MTKDTASSKEITTKQTTAVAVPDAPISYMTIINQAVEGKLPPETLHSLIDANERMMKKSAEIEFNQAMARLQPKIPIIQHKSQIKHNGKLISSYAKYEDIDRIIRPLYTAEGFSLSFTSKKQTDNSVIYYGTLSHQSGHSVTAEMTLPADTSGAKNQIQAIGSTVTYAKRYLVQMLFNLVTEGADDDGQTGGAHPIDDNQTNAIQKILDGFDGDLKPKVLKGFLKFMGVAEVADISHKDFEKAMNALKAKELELKKEPTI